MAKSGFGKAFAAARKEKGAGKTFMYNGKSYSTNLKKTANQWKVCSYRQGEGTV